MEKDIKEVLLTEEKIKAKIQELGEQITLDYAGKKLLLVGVLKGSVIFMADLVRAIKGSVEIDFMAVSSYGTSTSSSGVVRILKDLNDNVDGKHLLIVEDIIDSGLTLKYLIENLRSRNPASVRICTLLDKPERRKAKVDVDYNGFQIPDHFVVGYGLDYAEKYRNLPYIGILKPEAYSH